MKRPLKIFLSVVMVLVTVLSISVLPGCGPEKEFEWKNAIVRLRVDRKGYDFFQPWSSRVINIENKMGVVVRPKQILTTADDLEDRTLVRVQKQGRGRLWTAQVLWIDYHANLALLSVEDPIFWEGLTPAALAGRVPTKGTFHLKAWRDGMLEDWKAEISKLTVENGQLTFVPCPLLKLTSEISDGGWGEVICDGDKLIGITSAQGDEHNVTAIPSFFADAILRAREKGEERGLGYFSFTWQQAKNPANLKFLGQEGEPRGVIIDQISEYKDEAKTLRPKDILLEIDAIPIDNNGDYIDPEYGYLPFANLATKGRWAGDKMVFKIWRDRTEIIVEYVLPKAAFSDEILPRATFDQEPEYIVAGGLVFQPLTLSFLKGWGISWAEDSPFRLYYNRFLSPTKARPSFVFLSKVLPDGYNVGYQDYQYLVVENVNGRSIARMEDLWKELKTVPASGYHLIEFTRGRDRRRMILDAKELPTATARVLKTYGIEKDHVLAAEKDSAAPSASKL